MNAVPSTSRPGPRNADIRRRLGVRPVINLTGTLTTMGGVSARPEAAAAAAEMLLRGVDIVELQASASAVIARVTGAEAGFITACTSAGICMSVAGAMTGDDRGRIEQLPDTDGMRDEVVVQTGHLVNYGHPVAQDVRQTGARVVRVGDVNSARPHQLESALGPRTAAALYVVSHHCVQHGQIAFADFVDICHAAGVPVVVDLAAECDIHGYLRAGADLTVHSSHKFLRGPTAGIVCGRKTLVRAAFLQNYGIGRPMKAGKESVAGAIVALEDWAARDHAADRGAERRNLETWQARLARHPGVTASIDPDPTGNPFDRLKVAVDTQTAGRSALDVVWRLEVGDPPVIVRTHQIEHGYFIMDPRSLGDDELERVAARLDEILDGRDGCGEAPPDVHAWRRDKARALGRWPDMDAPA